MGSPSILWGDVSYPEIESRFPALQGDSLPSEPSGKPRLSNYVSLNKLYDLIDSLSSNNQFFQFSTITFAVKYSGTHVYLWWIHFDVWQN